MGRWQHLPPIEAENRAVDEQDAAIAHSSVALPCPCTLACIAETARHVLSGVDMRDKLCPSLLYQGRSEQGCFLWVWSSEYCNNFVKTIGLSHTYSLFMPCVACSTCTFNTGDRSYVQLQLPTGCAHSKKKFVHSFLILQGALHVHAAVNCITVIVNCITIIVNCITPLTHLALYVWPNHKIPLNLCFETHVWHAYFCWITSLIH